MEEGEIMSEIRNTYQEFQLENDEKVNLTLTFGKLNVLKSVNNELYSRYNNILYGKSEDIMDMVTIVYVAYWCANFSLGGDKLYSEEEFIELVPFDMVEIKRVYTSLIQPKKK